MAKHTSSQQDDTYQEHTVTKPFCSADPSCPCHEDQTNIAEINQHYQDGLFTEEEATAFVNGKMV